MYAGTRDVHVAHDPQQCPKMEITLATYMWSGAETLSIPAFSRVGVFDRGPRSPAQDAPATRHYGYGEDVRFHADGGGGGDGHREREATTCVRHAPRGVTSPPYGTRTLASDVCMYPKS